MNYENYLSTILQKSKNDSQTYEFLLSCSNFQVHQFYSESFNESLSPSFTTEIYDLLYIFLVKAIIKEESPDYYSIAVQYIKYFKEKNIEMSSLEKQLIILLMNSLNYESTESLLTTFQQISGIDESNLDSNSIRFFTGIRNFIISKSNENFDIFQYATMLVSIEFNSEHISIVFTYLDKLFIDVFHRVYREGNLELFMIFQKICAQHFLKDNKDIEAKYRALVGLRFTNIVKQYNKISVKFKELKNINQRHASDKFLYYSIENSENWYFRLINDVVLMEMILNKGGENRILGIAARKSPAKIDLALEINYQVKSLESIFNEAKKLPFNAFCLVFYKICEFLTTFQSFPIEFCLNTSCILLIPNGPVILLPDHSFCVVPRIFEPGASNFKPEASKPEQITYRLGLLMKDSLKYLVSSEEEYNDIQRSTEMITTNSSITLGQIIEYLKSRI